MQEVHKADHRNFFFFFIGKKQYIDKKKRNCKLPRSMLGGIIKRSQAENKKRDKRNSDKNPPALLIEKIYTPPRLIQAQKANNRKITNSTG